MISDLLYREVLESTRALRCVSLGVRLSLERLQCLTVIEASHSLGYTRPLRRDGSYSLRDLLRGSLAPHGMCIP